MYSDILHLRYRAETKDRPSWQAPAPQVQSLRAVFHRSLQAPVCRKRTTPRSHRAGRFSAIAGTGQLSAHSVPAPPASLLFPPPTSRRRCCSLLNPPHRPRKVPSVEKRESSRRGIPESGEAVVLTDIFSQILLYCFTAQIENIGAGL